MARQTQWFICYTVKYLKENLHKNAYVGLNFSELFTRIVFIASKASLFRKVGLKV